MVELGLYFEQRIQGNVCIFLFALFAGKNDQEVSTGKMYDFTTLVGNNTFNGIHTGIQQFGNLR